MVFSDENSDNILLNSLKRFYSVRDHSEKAMTILGPDSRISHRCIDWFVTTYSKSNRVVFSTTEGKIVDIHSSFKNQLKGFKKQNFDIFRRGNKKFVFELHRTLIETTLSQLNFVRWLIQYQIIDYYEKNQREIDAMVCNKNKPDTGKVSKMATMSHNPSNVSTRMSFD